MTTSITKNIENTIKYWYVPAIIGGVLIFAGAWALNTPGEAFQTLALFFSISFVLTGIMEIAFSIASREVLQGWVKSLVIGVVDLGIGIYLLTNPEISVGTLPLYIGFVVMFRSFSTIGNSFDLKAYGIPGWGKVLGMGVLGLLFSGVLISNPNFTGMTLVALVSIGLITIGISHISWSIQLKKVQNLSKRVTDTVEDLADFGKAIREEMEEEVVEA